ncbi:MAG: formylglycine-generating enzyme family protein, partial [Planctomycetaceae bacterium]
PWGDGWQGLYCNSEWRNAAMTPVGIYPAGAAPCGAEEMAGNVSEWTSSVYDSSQIQEPGAGRVLRGGSWDSDSVNCSAWYRDYCTPGYRDVDVGFRLARTLRPGP